MKKEERFTFLLTGDDRKRVDRLSTRLRRSRSDVIRLLVRAGFEAVENPSKEQTNNDNASTEN
jgi:hypothetical protein